MKRFSSYLLTMALAGAMFSCQKPEVVPGPDPTPDADPTEGYVTMTAVIPDSEVDMKWKSGDVLTVVGNGTEQYEIVPGFTARKAEFRGKAVAGTSFSVIYNASSMEEAEKYSFAGQTQSVNDSREHFKAPTVLTDLSDYKEVTFSEEWAEEVGATLLHSGFLKVTANIPSGARNIQRMSLKFNRKVFYENNTPESATDTVDFFFKNLDASALGQQFVACIQTSWQASAITGEESYKVYIESDGKYLQKESTLVDGRLNGTTMLTLDSKGWFGNAQSEGSYGNPYIIMTAEDLLLTKGRMVQDAIEPVCFKLGADIDMKDQAWAPLVTGNQCFPIDFNGDGHKISNLTVDGDMNFPSFAGVLDGCVHDITFENPVIRSTKGSITQTGVVTGWAGRSAGDISAEINNVTVTNATITIVSAVASPTGILAGEARNATFTGCSVSGKVNTAGVNAECNLAGMIGQVDAGCEISECSCEVDVTATAASRVVAGCIGSIRAACTISECSYKGTVTCKGAQYSGVFIGHVAGKANVNDCHAEGTFEGGSSRIGGLVGSIFAGGAGTQITGCSFKGAINIDGANDHNGALVGAIGQKAANNILISGCDVEADITSPGSKGNIGGILGANWNSAEGNVIEKCHYKGNIKTSASGNGGSVIGGICGYCQGITIRNCSSEGSISQCNYGIGGIGGTVFQNSTIENCVSSMDITARHGFGGIAGRADNNANASDASTSYNDAFVNCIAWNSSLTSSITERIGETNLSAGAIVGKTASKNTNKGCIRRSDMSFTCYADTSYDTLFDQEDSSTETGLNVEPSLGQYYWPYHGKATTLTASAAAKAAGWDESIWDLTGDYPVLRSF